MLKKDRLQKLANLLKEEKDLQECGCDDDAELHDDKLDVEGDDEGAMAKGQLELLKHNAEDLMEKLPSDAQLDAWVQSKITIASDMIDTVAHYLQDEEESDDSGEKNFEDSLREMSLGDEHPLDRTNRKTLLKKWHKQLKDVYHSMKREGEQPSDDLAKAINGLVNKIAGQ